jgi:hypothetical protein
LGYSDALDSGRAGRIAEIDSFVKRFRAAERGAAQSQLAQSADTIPAERFTPFEAGFISCRASDAGVRAQFFAGLQSLRPADTAGFVARWRGFVRREFKIYIDGSSDAQLPPGPLQYKDALDLINQRTGAIQAGGRAGQDVAAARQDPRPMRNAVQSILDEIH